MTCDTLLSKSETHPNGERQNMNLQSSELANSVTYVKLDGNLDVSGVGEVETRFHALCSGNRARVLVDLAATGFVGSLGVRMLLQAIKTVSAKGGRLLLLNPGSSVASTLEFSGLGQFVTSGTAAEAAKRNLAGES